MDTFLYKDRETGLCPVCDLLSSYKTKPKDFDRIKAVIDTVFNGLRGMSSKYVEPGEAKKCHDGKTIYFIRIQLPRGVLIRIFFVYFDNIAVLFDWLEKRHKPDYGKREQNGVDKKYLEKISSTAEFYKRYLSNKDCLRKINFK